MLNILIVSIYALGTGVSVMLIFWVWPFRHRTGAKPLLVTLAGATVWCGAPLAGTLIDSSVYSLHVYRIHFIGVTVGVLGLFVFALEYTGRERWITPKTIGLLLVEPIVALFFAFTNPRNLWFADIAADGLGYGLAIEWGPAFWIHAFYSYLLMLIASILIFEFLLRSQSIYRGQALALLGAVVFPWIASVIYSVDLVQFNTTPVGIAAAGILFAIAITRYQLIDIVPIAHDRVLDSISDAVLIVDDEERVIDANRTAKALAGRDGESVTGMQLTEFLRPVPEAVEYFREITERGESEVFELSFNDRDFSGEVSPIDDGRGRQVGWLIVAHDITDQRMRERELEQRNEQLDRFASIVSHDLRNPLNVATTRLELAQDECDSPHLAEVAGAHERIETIVAETLRLARLGETVDEPDEVDLETVVHQWWEGVQTDEAELVTEELPTILADPERLRHVFENLFRNALEHNEPPVTVRVGRLGDGFSVEDTGQGLPNDIDVFEVGETTADTGTGFGLSIVKEIVTAHGWNIATTTGADGGARFEITGVDIVDEPPPAEIEIGNE